MDLEGKVVLITGASQGIGLATARAFAPTGARLALVARSADLLQALAAELTEAGTETIAVPADLCDPCQVRDAIARTVEHFGRRKIALPTFAELGLPGFEDMPYYGIFASSGTSRADIDRFSAALAQVLAHQGQRAGKGSFGQHGYFSSRATIWL